MPVSVIMPAFNAGRFIAAALASLLAEGDAVDLDIVVVDDGSTDETRAIVAAIAAEHKAVRLLANPRKGIAAGRNTGIAERRKDSRFIAFMDADDLNARGRLARQRAMLLADPAIDVLYGRVQMFTESDPATLAPVRLADFVARVNVVRLATKLAAVAAVVAMGMALTRTRAPAARAEGSG